MVLSLNISINFVGKIVNRRRVCVSVDRHNTEEVSAGESLAGTNDFQ